MILCNENYRASRIISICGLFMTAHFISICSADVSLSTKAQDSCPSTDPDCNLDNPASERLQDYKLYQIEGGKTGFVQDVKLQGADYKLITRSMKPLLFEIPKFLSDEECDRIVELAKQQGLDESGVLDGGYDEFTPNNGTNKDKPGDDSDDSEDVDDDKKHQCSEMIADFDQDNNGQLSTKELVPFFKKASTSALKEDDIRIMIQKLKFDSNKDGEISLKECYKSNSSALEEYLDKIESTNPLYRTRFSQQTWLTVNNDSDPVLVRLKQRILELTKLPLKMLEDSEQLQVVRYTVNGHFHAHYDSTLKRNLPCCLDGGVGGESCNLCRFMTILYYLNDVPEGGETAFPVADNETYSDEEYHKRGLDNLSVRCHESNIVVKPVKGTAVMWYNHHIDPATGGMGMMDKYSLHGGCDVRKGIKWIANNWINAPYMHL